MLCYAREKKEESGEKVGKKGGKKIRLHENILKTSIVVSFSVFILISILTDAKYL